jgi:hypothetical protein
MGEHLVDEDRLPLEIDYGDQPVFVTSDIENHFAGALACIGG